MTGRGGVGTQLAAVVAPLRDVAQQRLGRDAPLLERICFLFVLLNVLIAVLTPLDLTYPEAPGWPRAGVLLVAFMGLGVWAVAYLRAGRPTLFLDLVPFALLLAGGTAAGIREFVFARMYVAVFLQAMYRPSRRRLAFLALGHFTTYELVRFLIGDPDQLGGMVSEGVSLVIVVAIMQTLATAVSRHERFTRRDAVLTSVVAQLMTDRDRDAVGRIVSDGVARLVDDPRAVVALWRGDRHQLTRVATAGEDPNDLTTISVDGLPGPLADVYVRGRPSLLDADALAALQSSYALVQPPTAVLAAPILRGPEPVGFIVVTTYGSELDDDLLPLIERFTYEVSLAEELAERDLLLSGIVESSSDVIAVVDGAGAIRYVSPALRTLTGMDPVALVGEDVTTLLALEDGRPVTDDDLDVTTPTVMSLLGPDGPVEVEVTGNDLAGTGRVLNIRDVSERRRLEAEVSFRAFHDSLTGIANRSLFVDRLTQALRRRDRGGRPVAVALLDLDDFKSVNDRLGHGAGDELLVEVASRLRSQLREVDTAARLGGDEFALILDGVTDVGQARRIIGRVLDSLREPIRVDGRDLSVTVSIGVAMDGTSPDDFVRNADAAMYAVKSAGKGRVAIFDPRMREESSRRTVLRAELETALANEELRLHYQPVRSLASGTVVGFEALVRWQHPTRGLLPPGEFIPMAEESGLVVPLGRWALREACRQAATWRTATGADIEMAVNLSALHLRDDQVVTDVLIALELSGLPARSLVLEVTETALMGDPDEIAEILRELEALGVRLAIDDFGTGYSSFAHLQRFPVDVLKVDRSFVNDVTAGPEQAALAQAIVKLANTLGIETVAEGVEHQAQADVLTSWGCTMAQGWLWAPALPPEQAVALLPTGVPTTA